jgi:hypothetical protein
MRSKGVFSALIIWIWQGVRAGAAINELRIED